MSKNLLLLFTLLILVSSCSQNISKKKNSENENTQKVTKFDKGYRYDKEGWIYVHVDGTSYERGKQFGYLIADDYKNNLKAFEEMTFKTTGINYSYFADLGIKLFKEKFPQELLEEMTGIADGLTDAGIKTSLDNIIA